MSMGIALGAAPSEDAGFLSHPRRQGVTVQSTSKPTPSTGMPPGRLPCPRSRRLHSHSRQVESTPSGPGAERAMPGKAVACAYAIAQRATDTRTTHSPSLSDQTHHHNLRPQPDGRQCARPERNH